MDFTTLWHYPVFSLGAYEVTGGNLLLAVTTLLVTLLSGQLVWRRLLPKVLNQEEVSAVSWRRLRRGWSFMLFWLLLLVWWSITGMDFNFKTLRFESLPLLNQGEAEQETYITITVRTLLLSLLTWQSAQWMRLFFGTVSLERYWVGRGLEADHQPGVGQVQEVDQQRMRRNIRYFIRTLAILLTISILDIDFRLLSFTLNEQSFSLRVSNVISGILLVLLARLLVWLTIRLFLSRVYHNQAVDAGSQFAINQLFRYVVYFLTLLLVLNVLGVNPTVLAGSAAALLLGVGLGLQQTFNDFFSGILLLFERSVEVGDVVEVGGLVGTVRRIGLRTSQVQTTGNLTVIVPNSQLVSSTVTNWSHTDYVARFSVAVGVAYGSDVRLVEKLLLGVATANEKVMNFPEPFVRFSNFGASSLDFELFFWSSELLPVDDIKSDLRFAIDAVFREHGIVIPFPQHDLWLRNASDFRSGD